MSSSVVNVLMATTPHTHTHTHTHTEVTKVEIDMEGQKVTVESTLSGDELLAILKKTGRECSYIGLKQ